MSFFLAPDRKSILPVNQSFTMTVFNRNQLHFSLGSGVEEKQCCTVPGDVATCCAPQVKRNRAFQTSALFKKPLR